VIGRLYLDPGDRQAGLYDPPRRCVVLTRWRQLRKGEKGGPRNVAVRYLDDGSTAVVPFARRLRLPGRFTVTNATTPVGGRAGLRRQLGWAEQRLTAATSREYQRPRVILVEGRRIIMLTGLLQAGPGHVFTPMGNWADRPPATWTDMDIPVCRLCTAIATEPEATGACPGDTHQCPVVITAGGGPVPARPALVCSSPGVMSGDFTWWLCAAGHVVDATHVPRFRDHDRVCGQVAGCPWPYLAGAG
jgi:hypothetical protein